MPVSDEYSRAVRHRIVYYSDSEVWGGAEQVLATLLPHLGEDWCVSVVGRSRAVCDRLASSRPDTTVRVVARHGRRSRLLALPALLRTLRELQPDVLHINLSYPFSSLEAQLAAQLTGRRHVVLHEHMPMRMKSRAHAWVKRLLSRGVAAHIVVGEGAASELAATSGIAPSRFEVIPNGIQPWRGAPHARVDKRPTVLGMGRVTAQKGFDVLLSAAATLPDVVVLLVGARTEQEIRELERMSERLGIRERVHIKAWDDAPRAWFGAADLFVLSSRFEAAPLVLLEALEAGLPVVSTEVGNAVAVLSRLAPGLVVPVDDAPALARAIDTVIRDAPLLATLSESGIRVVHENYSAAAMAHRFLKLYMSIKDAS